MQREIRSRFTPEHGEGVYYRTRLNQRRSKARDYSRGAAAGKTSYIQYVKKLNI